MVCCKSAWGDGADRPSDGLDQGLEWESQCAAGQRPQVIGCVYIKIAYGRNTCWAVIAAFQHEGRIGRFTSVKLTWDVKMNEKVPSLVFCFWDKNNVAQAHLELLFLLSLPPECLGSSMCHYFSLRMWFLDSKVLFRPNTVYYLDFPEACIP